VYSFLKNIVKQITPKSFLFTYEGKLRNLIYPFYIGNKVACNICNNTLNGFVSIETGDLLCPMCGSLPRTRRLYHLLNEQFLKNGDVVLDFSPHRAIFRKLKSNSSIEYFPTDYEDEFLADFHFDITNMAVEDEKFDLIICYHILEHIVADQQAMKELYRILKPDGRLLVQTPFKDGDIYEDVTIVSPEDRLSHFGQSDHVRVYSVSGLSSRLEMAGFKIQVMRYGKDEYYGFKENEVVIVASK
jgi:SAM-dependent methyltransferase